MLVKRRAHGWYTIPGFSNYQISEAGEVRRDPAIRIKGWGSRRKPGEILKQSKGDRVNKYLVLHLKGDSGLSKVCKVHQLVALTFSGPKPSPSHCALHRDDVKHNNNRSNIYWGTKRDNAIDRSRNGHSNAKLTLEDALWIRELYHGDKRTYDELAGMFRVRPEAVRQVVLKKTFGWYKSC